MANAASGVAKLCPLLQDQRQLLDAIRVASIHWFTHNASNFSPQELSSIAQSLSMVAGVESAPAFFEAATAAAEPAIDSYNPRELSSLGWALATAGCTAPAFFARVEEFADGGGLASFNSQSLAATSWSFAKLGIDAQALFSAVGHEVTKRYNELHPQDASMIVWSWVGAKISRILLVARQSRVTEHCRV
jgi:hypothetical protein